MTWAEHLADPPKRGSLGHDYLIEKAGQWHSCAVGEHLQSKGNYSKPKGKLEELGVAFSLSISLGHWEAAKEILKEIELL